MYTCVLIDKKQLQTISAELLVTTASSNLAKTDQQLQTACHLLTPMMKNDNGTLASIIVHDQLKSLLLTNAPSEKWIKSNHALWTELKRALSTQPIKHLAFDITELAKTPQKIIHVMEQLHHITYTFDHFKSDENKSTIGVTQISLIVEDQNDAIIKRFFDYANGLNKGIALAKDVSNMPANLMYPQKLATKATELAKRYDSLKIEILDAAALEKLSMNTILAVGQGSSRPPCLIKLTYQGNPQSKTWETALVGKGITFDSGGISLKAPDRMWEMKFDMGGAAAVLGIMQSLAEIKPNVNVIAILACAENMADGNATKPGDIVKTMSGHFVEILNTDAEGRLVLCDAITYVQQFNPAEIIDTATLTGAGIIGLGKYRASLFSNNDKLAADLMQSGERSGDLVWRMPTDDYYLEEMKSNHADLSNIGTNRPYGGAITAAKFLEVFCNQLPWAHVDVAGTAHTGGPKKASTGRPVPLLLDYLCHKDS